MKTEVIIACLFNHKFTTKGKKYIIKIEWNKMLKYRGHPRTTICRHHDYPIQIQAMEMAIWYCDTPWFVTAWPDLFSLTIKASVLTVTLSVPGTASVRSSCSSSSSSFSWVSPACCPPPLRAQCFRANFKTLDQRCVRATKKVSKFLFPDFSRDCGNFD